MGLEMVLMRMVAIKFDKDSSFGLILKKLMRIVMLNAKLVEKSLHCKACGKGFALHLKSHGMAGLMFHQS